MKKKNGFTLIELLVAIAIMLSILGIAIVSFVNVSDKKKEESWETVKGQIELAAEEFFTYNEYLFEGLSDGAEAEISVGKLVAEDYLNKVTNPITGKAVSECMIVKVTKTNGTYKLEVDDSSENSEKTMQECKIGSSLTIKETGAPEISVEKECGSEGKNGWCKKSSDGKGVTVTANAPEAVKVEYEVFNYSAGIWDPNGNKQAGKEHKDDANTNGKSVCFLATGSNGARASSCVDYKIDMNSPTVTVSIDSTESGYNSNIVNVNMTASDEISKVNSVKYSDGKEADYQKSGINEFNWNDKITERTLFSALSNTNLSATGKIVVTDMAGNEAKTTADYLTYAQCKNTEDGKTIYGEWNTCSKACGTGTQSRTVKTELVDVKTGNFCDTRNENDEEKNCKIKDCVELECPSVVPVGTKGNAVIDSNGNELKNSNGDTIYWYKKGSEKVSGCSESGEILTDSGCTYFGVKVIPKAGTDHWSWSTNSNDGSYTDWTLKNVGTITKKLSSGKRGYKIVVYGEDGTSKECTGTYYVDTIKPTIRIITAITQYTKGDNVCGNNNGAKTIYEVEDKESGINLMRDYYSKNANKYDDNYGTYRVKNGVITNSGIESHYNIIENKAINSKLSKVEYNDIWTRAGSCKTGSGIGKGNYYHKEKTCDNAGNCDSHISSKSANIK